MIFDGKPIEEISDEEIDSLVQEHYSEQQHLELKAAVHLREPDSKLEILRDIISLANGGGGYLIVGIQDDGHGRAQRFAPELVGDTHALKQSIASCCQDHIRERIDGLDIRERTVNGNPLVIVRVPASTRTPHMVTYRNRTDFWCRYESGKREMTFGEIQEAFRGDSTSLVLSDIQSQLLALGKTVSTVAQEMSGGSGTSVTPEMSGGSGTSITPEILSTTQLLDITDGSRLASITFKRFSSEINDNPYFRIAATPMTPRDNLIDTTSTVIRDLVSNPPGSRRSGWNMELSSAPIERFGAGLRRGPKDYEYLELFNNGHMEFWKPLDSHFCWTQSEDEFNKKPIMYPYPVVEYPTTFLRLYRAIIDGIAMNCDILIHLSYLNVERYALIPFTKNMAGYLFSGASRIHGEPNIIISGKKIPSNFNPDRVAYELISRVFASFGLDESLIPFFNTEEGKFNFG